MSEDEKKYELGYLLDDNLDENNITENAKELENVIEQKGGVVLERTLPKKRRLAYKIGHNFMGYFGAIIFTSSKSDLVSQLELDFKLRKDIIRFIAVKLTKESKKEELISPKLRTRKPTAPQIIDTGKKEAEKQTAASTEAALPPPKIKLEELDQKLEEILGQ